MARILLLDDDAELRAVLCVALQKAGHEVIEASQAGTAMKLVPVYPVDLFLTDIVMPGKEGIETIIEMKKAFPQLPIIAMSGAEFSAVYLHIAGQLGAVRTLMKPFPSSVLVDLIEELLRSKNVRVKNAPQTSI